MDLGLKSKILTNSLQTFGSNTSLFGTVFRSGPSASPNSFSATPPNGDVAVALCSAGIARGLQARKYATSRCAFRCSSSFDHSNSNKKMTNFPECLSTSGNRRQRISEAGSELINPH